MILAVLQAHSYEKHLCWQSRRLGSVIDCKSQLCRGRSAVQIPAEPIEHINFYSVAFFEGWCFWVGYVRRYLKNYTDRMPFCHRKTALQQTSSNTHILSIFIESRNTGSALIDGSGCHNRIYHCGLFNQAKRKKRARKSSRWKVFFLRFNLYY